MFPITDHNYFYLTEDRHLKPKEYFKFLVQQSSTLLSQPGVRVLDVGCAAGDFLFYVRSIHPEAQLTGIDITQEFIAKAQNLVPGATFLQADIYGGDNLPAESFDVVFMAGVNYLFPDPAQWIRKIISLTRGTAFVFGVFNPEDLDVRASVQRSGEVTAATSWNLISQKSVSLILDSLKMPHRFVEWEMPIVSPRSHVDPIRSWTIETSDGHHLVINGMQIVHRFAVLEIDVSRKNG